MLNYMKLTIPVVINTCYGGFGISKQAEDLLVERKGWILDENDGCLINTWMTVEDAIHRDDPDLVEIVHSLGEKANGPGAKLKVIDVYVTIDIDNFDGKESVNVTGYAGY